ncbi:MAG TPA: dienelactone hydrolase family protein [Vitreimonas sp.]|nr:dienelactone hydrolase family protein [Vitreimonas sp.]
MPEREDVRFDAGGQEMGGHLYRPAEPQGSVVVVPSVHGCNDYVADVSRALAARGYEAMTVDIYSRGDHPGDLSTPDRIQSAVAALPDDRVTADVVAAGQYLRDRDGGKVAVLGFCVGGLYAFRAAASDVFAAAIDFYGMIRYAPAIAASKAQEPVELAGDLQAPLLGHFGTLDPWCPAEHVAELRDRLSEHGKPHEIYDYPGAGHAFHEFHRPQVYRAVAAADAWRRTLGFLDYHLAGHAAL